MHIHSPSAMPTSAAQNCRHTQGSMPRRPHVTIGTAAMSAIAAGSRRHGRQVLRDGGQMGRQLPPQVAGTLLQHAERPPRRCCARLLRRFLYVDR